LYVRQRLSSEPDRYRGRRRVPTPPRSRYAVVGAAAFVGAGVVALGAGSIPDAKAVSPSVLKDLESSKISDQIAARNNDAGRADRSTRGTDATTKLSEDQIEAQAWLLPLDDFQFTSPFGVRMGKLHSGIDLAAPEGTPYKAVHGGKVTAAGYNGGYGYMISIQQDDGTEIIYAHSRRLLVKTGDVVKAGQVIAEVGNTGYSYGTHLHLEIHVHGKPVDPIPVLRAHGVDIKLKMEMVYGDLAAS
jgi:murein DD-endopeptidase MepM/ murein hydrolase activator NlpD